MKVDFKLLLALNNEARDWDIVTIIELLAMNDIPMSDAVIQLGIAGGVLLEGYKNSWGEEEAVEV